MSRPQNIRKICTPPEIVSFLPCSRENCDKVELALDEYETLRLVDFLKMTHAEASAQMKVSRTTVTQIYESARCKVADALVNGKKIFITGGAYAVCDRDEDEWCGNPDCPKRKKEKA